MLAVTTGFASGLALIIAIGAQNAFVLRQGLKRQNIFAVVLFCAVADAVLIGAGILGLGAVIESVPWLLVVLRFGGAAYLVWFGISSIRRAISPSTLETSGQAKSNLAKGNRNRGSAYVFESSRLHRHRYFAWINWQSVCK